MGCGCRRRQDPQLKVATPPKVSQTKMATALIKPDELSRRRGRCGGCKYNSARGSAVHKTVVMGKCMKIKKLIHDVISDVNFSCPIKKF